MPRKKKVVESVPDTIAPITRQPITETLEKNYMPYVMTVIISRAIPDIDGFKPSQRKLLYMMYHMNLLNGPRTKSANVVGATMRLNPHGDTSIYETLVRLTRGYEALLHPFIDSKGSFGKVYSKEMKYAAARYTEVKLDDFAEEVLGGIERDAVDMVPNYDNTMKEPVMFPTTFPNILVSPNLGIAVGLSSRICSFNLAEVCDGTIAMLQNPDITTEEMLTYIKAPDFSCGGYVIYDQEALKQVYETGDGPIRLRARYVYNPALSTIDILEIPYVTTIETISNKIINMMKSEQLKEIVDVRDAIDLNGFRLTIEIKKGTDPDKLMRRLFKCTELETNFDCNFNVLINSTPKTLGVMDMLREWIKFRLDCYKRELNFEIKKKKDRLHLLLGLQSILLDIDKCIKIIRETQKEDQVVPNLMKEYGLTEVQAEYVADIKLRHLNRDYILKQTKETSELQKEIHRLESILRSEREQKKEIAKQLLEIKKKYGKPRRSMLLSQDILPEYEEEIEEIEDYPCTVVVTKDGYLKKITPQAMNASDIQKIKEGDSIVYEEEVSNRSFVCIFTNLARMYRVNLSDFDTMKKSQLGEYLGAKFKMDDQEYIIGAQALKDFSTGNFGFIYENGKVTKTPVSAYETNRQKLTNAFSSTIPCVGFFYEGKKPISILLVANLRTNKELQERALIFTSDKLTPKATRGAIGETVFKLQKEWKVIRAITDLSELEPQVIKKFKTLIIPSTGTKIKSNPKK